MNRDPDSLDLQSRPAISDEMRRQIAETYQQLADTNRMLGQHDIAARCARNASAASYSGVLDLEPAESEVA